MKKICNIYQNIFTNGVCNQQSFPRYYFDTLAKAAAKMELFSSNIRSRFFSWIILDKINAICDFSKENKFEKLVKRVEEIVDVISSEPQFTKDACPIHNGKLESSVWSKNEWNINYFFWLFLIFSLKKWFMNLYLRKQRRKSWELNTFLNNIFRNKGFKCTVVNRNWSCFNGGSLEISLTQQYSL